MGEIWAHSANQAGVRHRLEDHLRGTAELAGGFAGAFGASEAGHFLGLAHDAGKASCDWQEKLDHVEASGAPVGIDHRTLGVRLAANRGLALMQYALDGHHGGLTDRDTIGRRLRLARSLVLSSSAGRPSPPFPGPTRPSGRRRCRRQERTTRPTRGRASQLQTTCGLRDGQRAATSRPAVCVRPPGPAAGDSCSPPL